MINLEKQLDAFYSSLNYNQLSTNAISVYNVILYIAIKAKSIDRLSIANTTLISICNLTIKELQNARNELIIKKYLNYEKGRNQNNAPKYSISILYQDNNIEIGQPNGQAERQPIGQPNGQAEGQPTGHIITILYLLFNYINKGENANFFKNIEESQRKGIQTVLKRFDIFIKNDETLQYFDNQKMLEILIQYYVVKELYFSPYKVILSKLTKEEFMLKFYKTKKYVDLNEENIYKFINYFIKSLKEKIDRGFENGKDNK